MILIFRANEREDRENERDTPYILGLTDQEWFYAGNCMLSPLFSSYPVRHWVGGLLSK